MEPLSDNTIIHVLAQFSGEYKKQYAIRAGKFIELMLPHEVDTDMPLERKLDVACAVETHRGGHHTVVKRADEYLMRRRCND